MRLPVFLASALLGSAPLASAQRFGFTHEMFPANADSTQAVALGDLDGDGDLDAFAANGGPGALDRLYRNDGNGAFADFTAGNLPAVLDDSRAVALGDVDGDGDLDAFVGNANLPSGQGAQNRLYLNNGAGAFADVTAGSLPALLVHTAAVALGDVDGDGDLDAVLGVTGVFGDVNRLYLNGGTGVFADATATNFPGGLASTEAVAFVDADGDGDLDVFAGTYGLCRLHLNNGAGTFVDATLTNIPLVGIGPAQAVAPGDVDGDGDLDVMVGVGGTGDSQSRLFRNGGTGIFTDATATSLPTLLAATQSVTLGDVDGDGDFDALFGNAAFQQNRLYVNGGAGAFTDATATSLPAFPGWTQAVALGDVDGDGDLDALLGTSGQSSLQLNSGTGVFADVTATGLPPSGDSSAAIALGDVDGDGDLDAFVGNSSFSTSLVQDRLCLNEGTGVFADATATNLPAIPGNTRAVALGDVDGDGDLDAVVGSYTQTNRLYLNGGGVFVDATATNLPSFAGFTAALALGDVDGDGDLDVLAGHSGVQSRLYLNVGTGVFVDATATNLPALWLQTQTVALGDVDGDGDLDAYVGDLSTSSFGSQDRLYVNLGTGVFADVTATNLPSFLGGAQAVALGDVDGDGDLDAFVGRVGQDRLFLNGGTGVFANATATNLPAVLDATNSVALGDVDEDGDLDAVTGNFAQQGRLYQNGGAGIFSDVTATALPTLLDTTQEIALGDVDGDGDLDVVSATGGRERLYTNLARQVSWRGIPRPGRPLILDVDGPANGTWLLAAATGASSLPLPPFGTLRLLPSALWIVTGGVLDPQGRASLSFLVPANPALVGQSVFWQAVVGPPLRFTNLEVTTVTNL